MKRSKLLLIVDYPPSTRLLLEILEPAGYEITHVATASDALRVAAHDSFDGVLMDYTLTDMESAHLCGLLREQMPERPIVFLSTSTRLTPEQIAEAGFDAYIDKPWHIHAPEVLHHHVTPYSNLYREELLQPTTRRRSTFGFFTPD